MSEVISDASPICHKEVGFSWIDLSMNGRGDIRHYMSKYINSRGKWSMAECPACKNCILIKLPNKTGIENHVLLPSKIPKPSSPKIKKEIRKDFDEARLCFNVGAFQACAVMCRRSLQAACKDQGATKKKLVNQIDELATKGIIIESIRKWAHNIRVVGNDAAHPRDIIVNKKDAKDILELTKQLLTLFYIMPSIALRTKNKQLDN